MTSNAQNLEAERARQEWLRLAPPPRRPRAAGLKWDIFLSYRSVNRTWALALHDALREAGYDVFLDQFVLPAGAELESFLRENLSASASGVVLWSGDAATSEFVKAELNAMRKLAKLRPDYHHVLALLDGSEPPFLEQGDLWADFTSYPEGPRGGELLKLMFGLSGRPLSEEAVYQTQQINEETAQIVRTIKAARDSEDPAALEQIAQNPSRVFFMTSFPYSVLVETLVEIGKEELAIEVAQAARLLFGHSVRLRQLEALAYRRLKRIPEALRILNELYGQNHRDPETLGILGASWTQRYKAEGKRVHLERAQQLYALAFDLVPDSYYTGVNAASKLALLGAIPESIKLAGRVLPLVSQYVNGEDYWGTASHAEVCLLRRDYAEATRLYRKAVVAHSGETSNIGSTRAQAHDLLEAQGADRATKDQILAAFDV